MRIGVISDIHADAQSLDGALSVLDGAGVDAIVCGGDVVERGSDADAVIETLQQRSIPTVQGNHDENAIRHARLSSHVEDGTERLSTGSLAYLEQLPLSLQLVFSELQVLLSHAIPSDNGGAAFQDESLSKLSKRFKKDLARVEADIVIVGHTHYPFDVTYRDKWIVNPGATCDLQSRDSHTCGILDLSTLGFSVIDLATKRPVDVPVLRFD